ncbi:hypothetical protein K439DRAFT_1190218 [Ramaria rubella]|nr:hypothetical protein K439DRAFT_1190218 [Ramaria rubella]
MDLATYLDILSTQTLEEEGRTHPVPVVETSTIWSQDVFAELQGGGDWGFFSLTAAASRTSPVPPEEPRTHGLDLNAPLFGASRSIVKSHVGSPLHRVLEYAKPSHTQLPPPGSCIFLFFELRAPFCLLNFYHQILVLIL